MNNTNINLLSYETCIKLKELGFSYNVEYYYEVDNDGNLTLISTDWGNFNSEQNLVSCPSTNIFFQWLRNEFNVDIFICRISNVTMPNLGYSFLLYKNGEIEPSICDEGFETYEQAELMAIKYIMMHTNEILDRIK